MAKPNARALSNASQKRPFAIHAAQFALWASLITLAVHFLTAEVSAFDSAIRIVVLALTCGTIVMGVLALMGMRRHGPHGVLIPGLIGVLLSSLTLGAIGYTALMPSPADLLARRLVGSWQTTLHTPGSNDVQTALTLRSDRSASARFSMGEKSMPVSGHWTVTWDAATQTTRLVIKWDPGADSRLGPGVVWIVEHFEPGRLTLQGKQGDNATHEIYMQIGD